MHYMFTDYLQHKTYENLQQLLQKTTATYEQDHCERAAAANEQQELSDNSDKRKSARGHSANPSLCRTQTEAERPVVTTISTCNHLPELGSLKASSGA